MNCYSADGARGPHSEPVAIITGGSTGTGREIACGLARWGWPVVVVYLEHQRRAEATVTEILAEEGSGVAVRADLADDLDVQRLFAESIAAFARVDVVVHTTAGSAKVLYGQAARHVCWRGAVVSLPGAEPVIPGTARQLREREISVGRLPFEAVLEFLDRWRRKRLAETLRRL